MNNISEYNNMFPSSSDWYIHFCWDYYAKYNIYFLPGSRTWRIISQEEQMLICPSFPEGKRGTMIAELSTAALKAFIQIEMQHGQESLDLEFQFHIFLGEHEKYIYTYEMGAHADEARNKINRGVDLAITLFEGNEFRPGSDDLDKQLRRISGIQEIAWPK